MAVIPVQGKLVLSEVSEDNGVTWLKIFCLIKQGFNAQKAVQSTETACGVLKGLGATDINVPIEGAVNEEVAVGFVSYKKMQEWFTEETALMFRQKSPNAGGFYNGITAYLTQINLDLPINNIAVFSATLSGFGDWVIVNPAP